MLAIPVVDANDSVVRPGFFASRLAPLEPTLAPLDGKRRNEWSTFRVEGLCRTDVQELRKKQLQLNLKAEDEVDEEIVDNEVSLYPV